MKFSRRTLLGGVTTLAAASATAGQGTDAHAGHAQPAAAPAVPKAAPTVPAARRGQARVKTLNGRSLEWRMNGGFKEFHLIAGEFEHEFAPGSRARCWGYNGSTPGPTIEAVEGDRVRILVTNRLPEPTTVHWHGLLIPNGMEGVGGLNQGHILPGETWAYEFTLREHGTFMYHPHADEMTQLAFGMMGMFIVHPRVPVDPPVDRDYAFLLHSWALHPGTYRPDPAVMTEFDLWTFNSKVFPAIEPMLAAQGERVRIRIGNLSMHNHPIHLHGHRFFVTGSDGGRWPRALWRPEVTEIIGVGQTRDLEFVADNPGDWAVHCHMSHHTMNAMGHALVNPVGASLAGLQDRLRQHLPDVMLMGENGMFEHGEHAGMGHFEGPENTLPMATGHGPFGAIAMGGMFTLLKVRPGLRGDADPGWYDGDGVPRARRVELPAGYAEPAPAPPQDHDHQ